MTKTYSDFGIEIKLGKTTGETVTTCPQCSHTRKKKTEKCLGVNLDKGAWRCNHCGWSGYLPKEVELKREYIRPKWNNNTLLSNGLVKWFEGRGISQSTLNKAKVSEGIEWMPQVGKEMNCVHFNYFYKDELINVKYRDGKKNFKLCKNAQKIPYNLNSVVDIEEVFIVEGEMDVLSFIEAGIENCISVPNGANLNTNNLDYFDDVIELFYGKKIVIATDNDNAGRKLRDDLSDRFGRSNCSWIDWEDFKDANEVLQKFGIQGVIEKISKRKEFDIVGSSSIAEYYDDVIDLFTNGLDNGIDVGDGVIGDNLRFAKGYITTITGIPGHGKSEFVDHMTIGLTINHNWSGAFYSPENKPTKLHIQKMIRKITGKGSYGANKPNELEVRNILEYLKEKIWFLKPPKGFTIDNILESVRELKMRKNIDYFVIDAWNKLEHKYDSNETKYIGESLDKIAVFCEENNVHCFLVAHPTKMQKDKLTGVYEVPNLYSIAGSANFYNKSDNGISVFRRFNPESPEDSYTEVHIQKVKFSHWGKIGSVQYDFDVASLRYRKRGTFENNNPMLTFNGEQQVIEQIERSSSQFPGLTIPEEPKPLTPNQEFDLSEDPNSCPF
jgi:twinkle protein